MRSLQRGWPSLAVAVVVVAVCTVRNASAQSASTVPNAASQAAALRRAIVMANIQQRFTGMVQLTASFRHAITDPTTNITKTTEGTVWATGAGQFRWDYFQKHRHIVTVRRSLIFDGQVLGDIDHDAKQITRGPLPQGAPNADAIMLLTRSGTFATGFGAALTTPTKFGNQDDVVLELVPPPSTRRPALYFVIAKSNWRVRMSIVVHPSGVTETFRFFAPDADRKIPPHVFQVQPSTLPHYTVSGGVRGGGGVPAPVTPGTGSGAPTGP